MLSTPDTIRCSKLECKMSRKKQKLMKVGKATFFTFSQHSKRSCLSQVYCVAVPGGNTTFQTPLGWEQARCDSARYPDFSEPDCYCLGDSRLTKAQTKSILDNACRSYAPRFVYQSMAVPLKQRCGVTDPTNPSKLNMCTCSEQMDNAAGD